MKKTLVLLGIFAVLFAFAYFYEYKGGLSRQQARELESSLLLIDDKEIESVSLIRAGQDTLMYVREDEDSWQIVSPVATSAENLTIQANLNAFTDARIKRRWTAARVKLYDFGLNPPEAMVIVKTRNGTEKRLMVGNQTAARGDIFVSLQEGDSQGDSAEILVTGNNVWVQATKSLFDLRDKKIAHFDEDQVNKVALNSEKANIILERSGGKWIMKSPSGVPVDDSRVTGFLRNLKSYSATAFVRERWEDGEPFGFNRPTIHIKLTLGEERSTKEIVVGKFDDEEEGYYAHESGRDPVFLIRESTHNTLAKEPFYFEERKLVSVEKEEVEEIRFSGAYRWTFVAEDTLGWYAHGDTSLKVDSSRMNRLFSSLRQVSLTEQVTYEPGDLVNYGFSSPFLEVVVVADNGEGTGFEIGDEFDDKRYIKRLDLPFVYSLPVSQVERITRWLEELKKDIS